MSDENEDTENFEAADVVIYPGTGRSDNDWPGYPEITHVFVEELRQLGVRVAYATPNGPQPVLELRSVEILLPVVELLRLVGAEVVADSIANALINVAGKMGWGESTAKIRATTNRGTKLSVEISGSAREIGKALRRLAVMLDDDESDGS